MQRIVEHVKQLFVEHKRPIYCCKSFNTKQLSLLLCKIILNLKTWILMPHLWHH